MQIPVRSISFILIVSAMASLSCGAIPGLFATPTPTPTSTPTPIPTATPSPTPTPVPTGIAAEKQPDGTTLVSDYDRGYQFVLESEWDVYVPAADGWASVLKKMPEYSPEAKFWKRKSVDLEPDFYRVVALMSASPYSNQDHFPMLFIAALPPNYRDSLPVDYYASLAESSLQYLKGMRSGFATNSAGIEFATFEQLQSQRGETFVGRSKVLFFQSAAGTMTLCVEAPAEIAAEVLADVESVADTIRLLPAGEAMESGLELVSQPDGGTRITDRQIGYRFDLDRSWHPIVVTADNEADLSLAVAEADDISRPDWHRVVILSHDPKYVAQRTAKSYAMHIWAGEHDLPNPDASMAEFLDGVALDFPKIYRTAVTVNSTGVEIGTIEAGITATSYTSKGFPIRFVASNFRVGPRMMYLAMVALEPVDKDLLRAFETIVDSVDLLYR